MGGRAETCAGRSGCPWLGGGHYDLGQFHHDRRDRALEIIWFIMVLIRGNHPQEIMVYNGLFEGNHPLLWPQDSGEWNMIIYPGMMVCYQCGPLFPPKRDVCWFRFAQKWRLFVISTINHSDIGVICTNLAIQRGPHIVSILADAHKTWWITMVLHDIIMVRYSKLGSFIQPIAVKNCRWAWVITGFAKDKSNM